MFDEDDVMRRALSAWFRTGGHDQPARTDSGVETVDGLDYVVLRNSYRTLAIYRIKPDGALKRLKRWPKALEQESVS